MEKFKDLTRKGVETLHVPRFMFSEHESMVEIVVFVATMLVLSPFFGVQWFILGDPWSNTVAVNFLHVIMIPALLLLVIVSSSIMELSPFLRKFFNFSTIPILFLSFLGAISIYTSQTYALNEVTETVRDVWMLLVGIMFTVNLLMVPFHSPSKFKKEWGAYLLITFSAVSTLIATLLGMLLAAMMFIGTSSIPFLGNYITSLGLGISDFEANLLTSHSHEVLPAIMGGIVGLTALFFRYGDLSKPKVMAVNLALFVSLIGSVVMTYIYVIAGVGTFAPPTLFASGPGGVNGLAEDDLFTGVVGIGAILAIPGLYWAIKKRYSGHRITPYSSLLIWILTMVGLVGLGYYIETQESYYGFGTSGVPPTGGSGYKFDLAFMDGHLISVFFLLPLMSIIVLSYLFIENKHKELVGYLTVLGSVVTILGLLVYTATLSWALEAIGLIILVLTICFVAYYQSIRILSPAKPELDD